MITIRQVKEIEESAEKARCENIKWASGVMALCERILSQHAEIQRLKRRIKNLKEWDRQKTNPAPRGESE
jgi:hypothetical protein